MATSENLFRNLFNTITNPFSSEQDIKRANAEFKAEQERNNRRIYESVGNLLQYADVSKAVKREQGFNVQVIRADGETNKAWASRTREIAMELKRVLPFGIAIDQETFKAGRIYPNLASKGPGRDSFENKALRCA